MNQRRHRNRRARARAQAPNPTDPRVSTDEHVVVDRSGAKNLVIRAHTEVAEQNVLDPTDAERIIRRLRAFGAIIWLAEEPPNVRLRIAYAPGVPPPRDVIELLSLHSRSLAKAVARIGEDAPPPDNPYGDRPHWGGQWKFLPEDA